MTVAVQRGYEDAMSLFSEAKSAPALLHALTRVANELGFDHAVLDYVPNRVTGMRPQHISTYSEQWMNESLQLPMGLIVRDPVLQHLDSSVAPTGASRTITRASSRKSTNSARATASAPASR